MAANRVVSKILFNFRPAGKIDDDIIAMEKAIWEEYDMDPDAMREQMQKVSDEEFAKTIRGIMDSVMGSFFNHPCIAEAVNACDQTTLAIPTTHDGDPDVSVLVHTPKAIARDTTRPCIVYAHGGGVVGGTAQLYSGYLSYMATECGVVVYNVDYRLAPETRCPNNMLDFYSVVKYVSQHAADLGVDPGRIAMAGESGGGYIIASTMVHLARKGEGSMVKLAVPIIPMLSDYCFSDKTAMTIEEAEQADGQKQIWSCIGGPKLESLSNDAVMYPAKADEETLANMPPTIVWEGEFDFYITEATRFANRLRAARRLLEFVVIPGAKHGSGMAPKHAVFKIEREAWRMAMQEYLVK